MAVMDSDNDAVFERVVDPARASHGHLDERIQTGRNPAVTPGILRIVGPIARSARAEISEPPHLPMLIEVPRPLPESSPKSATLQLPDNSDNVGTLVVCAAADQFRSLCLRSLESFGPARGCRQEYREFWLPVGPYWSERALESAHGLGPTTRWEIPRIVAKFP